MAEDRPRSKYNSCGELIEHGLAADDAYALGPPDEGLTDEDFYDLYGFVDLGMKKPEFSGPSTGYKKPLFIWGADAPPAGLSARQIVNLLCKCDILDGPRCPLHPYPSPRDLSARDRTRLLAQRGTAAQELADRLGGQGVQRELDRLRITPDVLALVLRSEWTPRDEEQADHWARILAEPPTLYRGFGCHPEDWRALHWTSWEEYALGFAKGWAEPRLATYRPHGNEIVALQSGAVLIAPRSIDPRRLQIREPVQADWDRLDALL